VLPVPSQWIAAADGDCEAVSLVEVILNEKSEHVLTLNFT